MLSIYLTIQIAALHLENDNKLCAVCIKLCINLYTIHICISSLHSFSTTICMLLRCRINNVLEHTFVGLRTNKNLHRLATLPSPAYFESRPANIIPVKMFGSVKISRMSCSGVPCSRSVCFKYNRWRRNLVKRITRYAVALYTINQVHQSFIELISREQCATTSRTMGPKLRMERRRKFITFPWKTLVNN